MKTNFFTNSRITGFFYLGLAITGMLAFLLARSRLFVEGEALTTTSNLVAQEGLARFGISAELALVIFQTLVALWFYKLFRNVDSFAALLLVSFGIINAVVIFIASAFWLGALNEALASESVILMPEQVRTSFLLFEMHETLWVIGKLFFGLWLIPMGYLVRVAKMPNLLSKTLVIGGVGYTVSLFTGILFPSIPPATLEMIALPATIGEFWMIGYLLFKKP